MHLSDREADAMTVTNSPQTAVDQPWNGTFEICDECAAETPHEVAIELRSESPDPKNAGCSREPYRVATCRHCGDETILRMNNA